MKAEKGIKNGVYGNGEKYLVKNKIAVITGAAKGIGAAVALRFAEHGAKGILIVDIDERIFITAKEICKKVECNCIPLRADVSSENDACSVFKLIIEKFGTVDILVNSAGICRMINMEELTIEQWNHTMDVNLKGTFLFSRAALKIMKEKHDGKIINVASQAGKIGGLIASMDYSASKAGVICLTKSLAKAAAPFNININSVAPGLINTEMTRDFGYDSAQVPLKRIGTPEEVADVVLFLASEMSRYITGACIDVNGGMTMW